MTLPTRRRSAFTTGGGWMAPASEAAKFFAGAYRHAEDVPRDGLLICYACGDHAPHGRVKRRYERGLEVGYSYGWYHHRCKARDDRKPSRS